MLTRYGLQGICLLLGLLALVLLGRSQATAQEKEDPIVAFIKPRLKDPDKPFTLIVHIKVKEGAGGKFEAAFAKARKPTRQEQGNAIYDLSRDTKDASEYVVYERWKDLASLEAHLKTPHIKTLLSELPELTAGPPELHVLLPVAE